MIRIYLCILIKRVFMKKTLIFLLVLTFSSVYGFCSDQVEEKMLESVKKNPGITLNSQDVPIFFEKDNPLTGMRTFNLIPPLSLKDTQTQKNLQKVIEKELEQAGEVVHLKATDMRGMGCGNILNIQLGDVLGWNEEKLTISRISLQVETFVVINKTGIKTFPAVWSINTFFQDSTHSEVTLLKATQKLVKDFVQNYKYANQGQKEKPVFYTYY